MAQAIANDEKSPFQLSHLEEAIEFNDQFQSDFRGAGQLESMRLYFWVDIVFDWFARVHFGWIIESSRTKWASIAAIASRSRFNVAWRGLLAASRLMLTLWHWLIFALRSYLPSRTCSYCAVHRRWMRASATMEELMHLSTAWLGSASIHDVHAKSHGSTHHACAK